MYSLLSHDQIHLLLDDGVVVYAKPEHINSASLDIQLGRKLLIERKTPDSFNDNVLSRVVLRNREQLNMIEWDLEREGPYIIYPGEFLLAHSVELFNLPNNISAKYHLKSSMARIGLEHLNAGWCDAGWHGSVLTLELKNVTRHHEIVIQAGDLIGQMVFFLHEQVSESKSYAARGRYNNDKSVSGAKRKRKTVIFGEQSEEAYQEEYNRDHPVIEPIIEPPRKILEVGDEKED